MMRKILFVLTVFVLSGSFQISTPTQAVVVEEPKMNVAILIFDGVQIIDYTGPYEVFGAAGLNVYTVSEKTEAITTNMGMSVNPKYNFDNHPKPDILLIPGGSVGKQLENPKVIQ